MTGIIKCKKLLVAFAKHQDGAVAVEYVIVASAMCLALVALLPALSASVTSVFLQILGYFGI